MTSLNREELVNQLEQFLQKLKDYRTRLQNGEDWRNFEDMREQLVREAGSLKQTVVMLVGKRVASAWGFQWDVWNRALERQPQAPEKLWSLSALIDAVNEAIGKLNASSEESVLSTAPLSSAERPKAFIAHGGSPPALKHLKEFLEALGIDPLVVEGLASQGRSVDQNVDFYLSQADCGIVLATADDLVDGKFQPRGNVLDEHGRLRQKFPHKVVYLLEGGASFPSNIDEKVWERFTQDNMEKAFVKVARELKAFGIIKAAKPIP